MTKIWITKYALTGGILERDAEIGDTGVAWVPVMGKYFHRHGVDYHTEKKNAMQRARDMRLEAIESLTERLERLEDMNHHLEVHSVPQ